jgi:hypothetical protein
MDLAASILEAAGAPVPPETKLEGINLFPVLEGRAPEVERTLFWRVTGPSPQRAVRAGEWKLIFDVGRPMLFNLHTDVGERNNVIAQHPEIATRLRSLLEAWQLGVDGDAKTAMGRPGQQVRDFSGTWAWVTRPIARPMLIRQTSEELIVASMGLPQGAGDEAFWFNGAERVETDQSAGFTRKYQTSGRWQGESWVGTVKAFAGWTEATVAREPHTTMIRRFSLDATRTRLTIVSSGDRPATGGQPVDTIDELVRVK